MFRSTACLLGLLLFLPWPAPAQEPPDIHATYEMYAAGLHVAEVEAFMVVGPQHYQMRLAYHTTGLVGFFHHGHQVNTVLGQWNAGRPQPREFKGVGVWHGEDRETLIAYPNGQPVIERLEPSQATEREPVPPALQQNTVDSLSALALLMRRVQETGRCEASVRTFDGHRASEISASTAGEEAITRSLYSVFSGKALRCNFVGQMLAGFLYTDNTPADRRPLHGSAWLAPVVAGAPPIPVMMQFDTRWFGEAHMYLTKLEHEPPTEVAAH